jgi:hypothetical protein
MKTLRTYKFQTKQAARMAQRALKDLEHGCLGNEGFMQHGSQAEPKFPEHPNSRSLILTQCKDLVEF